MLADRPQSNTNSELNRNYPHHIAKPEVANRIKAISYELLDPELEGNKDKGWIRNVFPKDFMHFHRWN